MTRLFMGWKSGVGSVLKVMANDTDDPLTTPNTDYAKFRFNSETGKIGYIKDTYTLAGPQVGANQDNLYIMTPSEFPKLPLMEVRTKLASGRVRKGGDVYGEATYPGGFLGIYNYSYNTIGVSVTALRQTYMPTYAGDSYNPLVAFIGIYGGWVYRPTQGSLTFGTVSVLTNSNFAVGQNLLDQSRGSSGTYNLYTQWDLPAKNEALPVDGAYVAGKKMLIMSPSIVKLARGGFDVDTATYDQLILSSEKIPAKIIKCGDISILANSNITVATPVAFPLTGNVYVDFMVHVANENRYIPFYRTTYSYFSGSEVVIEYEILTNSVVFYNLSASDVLIRYMIIGDDDNPQSSGGGKVLETGADYQRILRPGASPTNPSWSDILLDTRLPYLPMLAEGYEPVSAFSTNTVAVPYLGNIMKTVSFTNGGLKPFPKISVVYENGNTYAPTARLFRGGGFGTFLGGTSGLCEYTDTSITFRTSTAATHAYVDYQNETTALVHNGFRPIGFRYYILGLPI